MNNVVLVGGLIGLAAVAGLPAANWLGATRPAPSLTAGEAQAAPAAARLSEDEARRIAWGSGLDHIEEIVLSGERWEVAGRDRTGLEIRLDIDAVDGRLLH